MVDVAFILLGVGVLALTGLYAVALQGMQRGDR